MQIVKKIYSLISFILVILSLTYICYYITVAVVLPTITTAIEMPYSESLYKLSFWIIGLVIVIWFSKFLLPIFFFIRDKIYQRFWLQRSDSSLLFYHGQNVIVGRNTNKIEELFPLLENCVIVRRNTYVIIEDLNPSVINFYLDRGYDFDILYDGKLYEEITDDDDLLLEKIDLEVADEYQYRSRYELYKETAKKEPIYIDTEELEGMITANEEFESVQITDKDMKLIQIFKAKRK